MSEKMNAGGVLLGLIILDDLLGILSEQLRAMVPAIDAEQLRERKLRPRRGSAAGTAAAAAP